MIHQEAEPRNTPQPVVVLSSGGKDSLCMIDCLRFDPGWRIEGLLTTVQASDRRVALHGVSAGLLRAQAESLDLPLKLVELPEACDNAEYRHRVRTALGEFAQQGVEHLACGDLFLEDIRQWREASFGEQGWRLVFPIWGTPTLDLARRMAGSNWEVVVTGVDTAVLGESFLGRPFDEALLESLPEGVDPCGENGEFHTFVCNGPGFRFRVPFRAGDTRRHHDRYLTLELDPV